MSEEYSKHLAKRIREMRERMVKSNLDRAKKKKYWIFNMEVKYGKKKDFFQRFRRGAKEEGKIVPRHKIRVDKDKKK